MNPLQKWLVWSSSLATGGTGVLYWWMKNMLEPVDPWAAIHHPLQPWVLKAHIVAAPLLVFSVGLIASDHIWKHYKSKVRAGRRSGSFALWVLAPMVFSGYLIQAVTAPAWLAVVVWVHVGTSAIYVIALVLHHRVFRTGGRRATR